MISRNVFFKCRLRQNSYVHLSNDRTVYVQLSNGWSVYVQLSYNWTVHIYLSDGLTVCVQLSNGWTVNVQRSNNWTVHILLSDGWTAHVQLSNSWKVYVQLFDDFTWYVQLSNDWTVDVQVSDDWTVHIQLYSTVQNDHNLFYSFCSSSDSELYLAVWLFGLDWTEVLIFYIHSIYGTKSKSHKIHVNVTKFYALFQAENHGKIGAFWKIILVWPSHAIGQFQTFLTPVHCTALGCITQH